MPVVQVGKRTRACKYQANPSNAAEILALFADHQIIEGCSVSIQSETGGVLRLRHNPYGVQESLGEFANGEWLIVEQGVLYSSGGIGDTEFAARYRTFSQVADALMDEPEMKLKVADMIASSIGAFGMAAIPALNANGVNNVAVTIKPTMPNLSYTASAGISGGAALLGALSTGTPVKTSTSVVTVPVTNTGLITLSGASLWVHVTP